MTIHIVLIKKSLYVLCLYGGKFCERERRGEVEMFFKKTKVYEAEEIDEGELVLHVPRNSDLEKQIMMIGLTKQDLQLVRQMQPFIMKNIYGLVEQFYSSLYEEPSLIETINKHSSVEKLKGTLKNHIVEIFNGIIDQEYIEKRKRIAHIHVRIGLISASGCSLSAGWAVSLLGASTCGVSPVPLLLQESRTLRSNQPIIFIKKQQSFRKEQKKD